MQKHAGEQLIEILLLMFEERDIEQELVHLGGMLKEIVVAARWKHDMLNDEYQEADCDEEGGEGGKLEVGTYSISQQIHEGVIGFLNGCCVYVRDLDFAHFIKFL